MSKLIEVVVVRDGFVIDGLIHGAHHRNKEATDKMREARKLNHTDTFNEFKSVLQTRPFVYVDVTEKAAESALFAKLRRDPIGIKAVGVHTSSAQLRGHTLNGINVVMSESLQVIDAAELANSLEEMFRTIRTASTAGFPTRVYVPVEFSDKFEACMKSWIVKESLSRPQSGGIGILGDSNIVPRVLALDSLMEMFTDAPKTANLRYDSFSLDPEMESAFSDHLIGRLENVMRMNNATLYLSKPRYSAFVLSKFYRSSGATA